MDNTNRLGEMLLLAGLIDQFQLESALSMQRNLGGQIGNALVKLGYLPQATIDEFLESQEKNSHVPLEEQILTEEILSLLPLERMEELTVMPVELRKLENEKILRVAMTDPDNLQLIDKLQFITGCKIIPLQAAAEEILRAVDNNAPIEPPEDTAELGSPLGAAPDHRRPDFAAISGEDPRLDRLLNILMEKGVLSPLDIERIKFN